MIKLFQGIYTIYSILIFFLLMITLALPIMVPILISPKGDKISFFFLRLWARIWSFLSGIRYEIHGREHIDSKQAYIYIFNHRSFVDAPVIPIAIPQPLRALGKKELSRIPLFGWVVGRLAVWVDRNSTESRKASIERLIQILQTGKSVVVAPEGTRNDSPELLLPFQYGAFRLAIECQTPILPLAIIGADHIMKRGSLLLSPGKVRIYFSKPIFPPKPEEDAVHQFAEHCRNRLEAMLVAHD